jgi:hypothetical protein
MSISHTDRGGFKENVGTAEDVQDFNTFTARGRLSFCRVLI